MITRVRSPKVPEPSDGRFSNCLMVDGIAYIAGMTASEGGDVYAQATIIFGKIRELVESAGGSMADVVKITVYVKDIDQRQGVWKARQEHFRGDFPAATMVQVAALARPVYQVEIDAIAHIGAGRR
ncbi:MAG: RidA family protein [Hyphomicrobiales bacterium]|nr:RidA family protein [Hyphomicrobiales bacterium]